MAAAGPRHSPPGRTVQAAPPPAPLPARARGRRCTARGPRSAAAQGRRARAAWGSAGPRRGACRAARISWAREAGLEDPSLHRRVCAATRGATRVPPALRAPGLRGCPSPGTGRQRRTGNVGVARFCPACVLTEANRANFHQDSVAAPCSAKHAEPGDGTALAPKGLTRARSSSQTSTASREQC